MNKQQIISAHILSAVRAAEANHGIASVQHFFQSRFANKGTPPRLHKNVIDGKTRGERKRAQRKAVIDKLMSGPVATY